MRKEKYSIAIIGAGNIAAGFDSSTDDHILTHAHAIKINSRLNCLGFFDVNPTVVSQASSKWGFPILRSFQELIEKKPDIVVICSPDAQHVNDLQNLLTATSASFIICEKPLCTTYSDSQEIVSLSQEKKVPLLVNYQRRYDQSVIKIKQQFDNGVFGKPITVNVMYSKGILHNGSHAVNLLLYFFGNPIGVNIVRKNYDFYKTDPTVDGTLHFDSFVANFIAGDESQFSIFEIDMVFEKMRIRFTSSGNKLEKYSVAPDPVFPSYKELKFEESSNTELVFALKHVYSDVLRHLDKDIKSNEHLADSVKTQFICEAFSSYSLFQYHKLLQG